MKKTSILISALLLFSISQHLNAQFTNYWTSIYGTANNGLDKAIAITSDANCFVYVTGTSEGISSGQDYLTIKYDIHGNIVWSKRYDGGANGDDEPVAIAVDATGNVYVTGKSQGTGTGYDYATIKYDAGGTIQWGGAKRFNNPGSNGDEIPVAMYLDATGQNLYVGGSSFNYAGANTGDDVVILKYNTSNGAIDTAVVYSSSNISVPQPDLITEMKVNNSGEIYLLTSWSNAGSSIKGWTLLKFNSSGTQLAAEYNDGFAGTPLAMDIDGSGNVYAESSKGHLILTKYVPSGNLFTKAYTTSWFSSYAGLNGKVKVQNGNLYGFATADTGTGNKDVIAFKLNSTGNTVWRNSYGSPTTDDKGSSLDLDVNGNVYLTGYITNTNKDIFINKYATATGALTALTSTPYDGIDHADDAGNQIVVTAEKNILVAGYTTSNTSLEDFFVRKYVDTFFMPTAVNPAGANTQVCLGHSISIGAVDNSDYTYHWSPANTLSDSTVANPTATPVVPIEYHLTVTAGCATAFDTVMVDTLHCTTGIEDIADLVQLHLFPNPASDQLFIETYGTEIQQINIYNTAGSLAMVAVGSSMVNGQLSIVNLSSGVYIAEIKTKEGTARKRWVKM